MIYGALDGEFSKSQINKRLKQLGLTGRRGRAKTVFTEAQDEQIRQLFEK